MRALLRLVLVLVLVGFIAFLALGFWAGRHSTTTASARPDSTSVGTSGSAVDKPRERGAELGEKAASAAVKAKDTMAEAGVTAKIKAKMALDDTVKSRTIDVTTNGTTVTLSGTVRSAAERDKAIALARETAGITRVIDNLKIDR